MTGVYSGGLMYEYALEANGFGIAKLGSGVKELDDFSKFQKALKENPMPKGDGGFTSTTKAVACPTKDSKWLVEGTLLPAIPTDALKVGYSRSVDREVTLLTRLLVHVRRRWQGAGSQGRRLAERRRGYQHGRRAAGLWGRHQRPGLSAVVF